MYEQNRRYGYCILCGESPTTKEHIFGKAFARHLGVEHHWSAHTTPGPSKPAGMRKGSNPITHVAPSVLCDRCNSHRLSPSMAASLGPLISLVDGTADTVSAVDRAALCRYFERVALIMDVCTSTEQIPEARMRSPEFQDVAFHRQAPPVIDQKSRAAWLDGAPLGGVKIIVGKHLGVLGLNPVLNVVHLRLKNAANEELIHHQKRVLMVFRQLAVCVFIGEPFPDAPRSFTELTNVVAWPASNGNVSYDDFFSMYQQSELIGYLRLTLGFPANVEEMEQLSRRAETLTFPFWMQQVMSGLAD